MQKLKYLMLLFLASCGGGAPDSVVFNLNGNVTCNTCTLTGLPASAASAPSQPEPSAPVPLAVPQTNSDPFVDVCAGCLKWSAGGIHYAVVFRDLSGAAQIAMVVSCSEADCTPGPNVWQVAPPIIDDQVDLDLIAMHADASTANATLLAYAKGTIFPALASWFDANRGNLLNQLKVEPTSTLPVPETGDPFARLTAIFNEHVIISSGAVASWKEP